MNEKKKARPRYRRYLLLILIGIPLLLLLVLLCLLKSVLPWRNMVAATSSFEVPLSDGLKRFVKGGERDYSTLPDPLQREDGSTVETEQAFAARREEILALFQKEVYGPIPTSGFDTTFQVVEEGEALQGKAIRKQVKITVQTEKGSSDALLLLYLPKSKDPAPVILGLNFSGNHMILDDPAILPSYGIAKEEKELEEERGSKAYRWNVEECISKGRAVATICCEDFAPDSAKNYASRVVSLFDEEEFKAISAWSFGLMRGVDYLTEDSGIDTEHIAVIGHSRLGKAAVWAGANDQRIGLVISNDSGNTGASLSRENHGETVASINKVFPHWFCSNYKKYGHHEDTLPVDQNLLLATIAPRKLYVACAEDDLWADPQGAWNSLMSAQKAFALYGLETLPESKTQPEAGTPLWSNSVGYHVRSGWHEVQPEDWKYYLEYMDRYFVK